LETIEIIKFVVLVFLYLAVGPLLGLFLKGRTHWQRLAFAAMCFMTISGFMEPAEWGLTLANDENYRGHARGFHFYFNEVLAIGLILARALDERVGVRLFPPGLWLYLLWCLLSLFSLINAPNATYTFMAAFKAFKVTLIFIAAYNFMRTEKDVRFFLTAMSLTMLWQAYVVLKLKYYDGIYQVYGTFEHQNALSMYAMMIGIVLLAVGAGDKSRWANLYLVGFFASAIVSHSSLSRAGLVLFAVGTVVVLFLGFIDKITWRRIWVLGVVAVLGMAGLGKSIDTVIERFKDPYNNDSNQTRYMLNVSSRQMFQDYRLGVGWNNYGIMINYPYSYGDIIDQWFLSHGERIDPLHKKGISESLYYLVLAETGIQGFIGLLAFITLFLYWNLRGMLFFRARFAGMVSLGIAIGCGLNYTQSLLERVLTQPRNMMLWFLLLALTARIEMWRRQTRKQPRVTIRELEEEDEMPLLEEAPAAPLLHSAE
jgi:hypothetical protein